MPSSRFTAWMLPCLLHFLAFPSLHPSISNLWDFLWNRYVTEIHHSLCWKLYIQSAIFVWKACMHLNSIYHGGTEGFCKPMFSRAPPLLLPCAWAPPFYETWNAHAQIRNGFQQIRKFSIYTLASEVKMVLLVKDHARKGKESFHVRRGWACAVNPCTHSHELTVPGIIVCTSNGWQPAWD